MNIDYTTIAHEVLDGTFRQKLEDELVAQFRAIQESGERVPLASYLATQIAEIVNRDVELQAELKYDLYQEILAACEHARATVLGERDNIAP